MCKVSVVVPVYKVEKYLPKCVESLLNQTLQDIEIILVDDGSPDKCGQLCDQYAQLDNRIRVVHKENGGLSDARNVGMKYATGEYLGFVDSDDYVTADMFQLLYENCVNNDAEISGCDLAYVYENKSDIISNSDNKTYVLTPDEFYCRMIDTDGFLRVGVWNKLYKRELFANIEFPKGKLFEDIGTLYKVIFQAKKTVYISKPCYMYLKERSGAITVGGFKKGDLDRLEMGDGLINYIRMNRKQILNQVIAFKCVSCNLTIINLMIRSDALDEMIIRKLQLETRGYLKNILSSNIRLMKKAQLVLFGFSFRGYKIIFNSLNK
ncbi:MAG: glycosyltransferase [Eubacterium sp.]|nr:glycosyltransferase [Eubacterium sp.]